MGHDNRRRSVNLETLSHASIAPAINGQVWRGLGKVVGNDLVSGEGY
jgi:hypothetical protein